MTTQEGKTVLLAGASGVLGRHITAALTGAGHTVRSLGRAAGNDVTADLTDREGLLRAVDGKGADVVIHAATALRKPPTAHRDMSATDRLRIAGTRNLLDAAREVGAKRFLTESMVFGYGYADHGTAELTEDAPWAPAQRDRRMAEHVAAMRVKEELTFTADGIDGVSLRYGLFYGRGGTETIVEMLRKRMMPAPDTHGRVLPWVNVHDAGRAMLAALEHGRAGQAYNIADDDPMGFGDHVRLTAAAFGTPKPVRVPVWLLRPMPYLHTFLLGNMRVSTAKAAAEFGWRPVYASARDGLAALRAGE